MLLRKPKHAPTYFPKGALEFGNAIEYDLGTPVALAEGLYGVKAIAEVGPLLYLYTIVNTGGAYYRPYLHIFNKSTRVLHRSRFQVGNSEGGWLPIEMDAMDNYLIQRQSGSSGYNICTVNPATGASPYVSQAGRELPEGILWQQPFVMTPKFHRNSEGTVLTTQYLAQRSYAAGNPIVASTIVVKKVVGSAEEVIGYTGVYDPYQDGTPSVVSFDNDTLIIAIKTASTLLSTCKFEKYRVIDGELRLINSGEFLTEGTNHFLAVSRNARTTIILLGLNNQRRSIISLPDEGSMEVTTDLDYFRDVENKRRGYVSNDGQYYFEEDDGIISVYLNGDTLNMVNKVALSSLNGGNNPAFTYSIRYVPHIPNNANNCLFLDVVYSRYARFMSYQEIGV